MAALPRDSRVCSSVIGRLQQKWKNSKEVNKNVVAENFEWSYDSGLASSQLTSALSDEQTLGLKKYLEQ